MLAWILQAYEILQAYNQCVHPYPRLRNVQEWQSIDTLGYVFDLTGSQENATCKWKQQICRLRKKRDTLSAKLCACRSHLCSGALVSEHSIFETRFLKTEHVERALVVQPTDTCGFSGPVCVPD